MNLRSSIRSGFPKRSPTDIPATTSRPTTWPKGASPKKEKAINIKDLIGRGYTILKDVFKEDKAIDSVSNGHILE